MLKDITPRDWGAFIISLIFLSFFGAYEAAVVFFKLPKDDGFQNILNNLAILVAGYWIGSSKSTSQNAAANATALTRLTEAAQKPTGDGK